MIKTEHRQINDGYKLKESHLNDRRHELETKANGHQVPVVWDSAVDYNVFDKDGNKWIDMTAGIFAPTQDILIQKSRRLSKTS